MNITQYLTSDNVCMTVAVAILTGLIIGLFTDVTRENSHSRRFWKVYWSIAGSIFLAMTGLAFFGLVAIPMTIIFVILLVVVVGGFIGMCLIRN